MFKKDVSESCPQPPTVVEVAECDGEPKPVGHDVESDIPVGAVGAAILLRLDVLRMRPVDGGAVVGRLVEVDGDIQWVGGRKGRACSRRARVRARWVFRRTRSSRARWLCRSEEPCSNQRGLGQWVSDGRQPAAEGR